MLVANLSVDWTGRATAKFERAFLIDSEDGPILER